MRYRVLENFKVRTTGREVELQQGQIIQLDKDKAIPLIEAGKITPIERVAYKIYSELLGCYLWVVGDDEGADLLRSQGVTETIYTTDEVRKLKGLSKETLKKIHEVKTEIENSTIIDVRPNGNNSGLGPSSEKGLTGRQARKIPLGKK
mgnify:CR=1 FL=1